jgi:hypothetical protein
MLQVFYLDVAYVCNSFQVFLGVFASVSDACFKCSIYLYSMLQVLYLDISKVDRVLHMLQCVPPATVDEGGTRGRVEAQTPVGSDGTRSAGVGTGAGNVCFWTSGC